MNVQLQNKLFEKYPKIFRQKDLPVTQSCMGWGITCGDGWFWLIDRLCNCIQSHLDDNPYIYTRKRNLLGRVLFFLSDNNYIILRFGSFTEKIKRKQIEAVQVKEKFGTLRMYLQNSSEYIEGMVHLAECMSAYVCEECGSIDNVTQTRGWIHTRCPECLKKLQVEARIL